MDSFALLKTAASGMDAQRAALDVAAENVAAAQAAGPRGSHERFVAQFRLVRDAQGEETVQYAGAQRQRGSSVDTLQEMVSVLDASRAYEANASVFEIGKRLAERTIEMGRV